MIVDINAVSQQSMLHFYGTNFQNCLRCVDTWDRALCLAKRACATLDTNLESNSGSPNTQACGKPSMEEFPDYSETESKSINFLRCYF